MDILNVLKSRIEIVDDAVSSRQLVDQLVANAPQEESLHLTELDNVVKRHYDWVRHLPWVRPFYTVQANDDVRIISTTVLLDCGFVCASKVEVLKVFEFCVDPSWILLNSSADENLLKFARRKGINVVFDSKEELRRIHQCYPEAQILLKFRLSSDINEGRELLNLAKELGLDVVGWCFNAGSECSDPSVFYDAIRKGRQLTDHATIVGYNFNFINLGGGFCGQKDIHVEQFATFINQGLGDFFPERHSWTVAAEVGSFHSAAAVTAITTIRGKRIFWDPKVPSRIDRVFYYLSEDVGRINHAMVHSSGRTNPIVWKDRRKCGAECNSTLYGPVGDEYLRKDLMLPELNETDFLVFEGQGVVSRHNPDDVFSIPIRMVFIRRSMWELLISLSVSKFTKEFVLSSRYLKNVCKLEDLQYARD